MVYYLSLSGLISGERNGNPFQYSCLGNPMDREAWKATVDGVSRVGHDLATKPPPVYLLKKIIISWSIHVAPYGIVSLFFMAE